MGLPRQLIYRIQRNLAANAGNGQTVTRRKKSVKPLKDRISEFLWKKEMEKLPGIFLPLHTTTPGNNLRHWSKEAEDTRKRRKAAELGCLSRKSSLPPFPVRVTITRYGPRKLDKQNLPGAAKHVIDGIADFYRVNDGDDRWQFKFEQEISRFYGVRIEVERYSWKLQEPPNDIDQRADRSGQKAM